MALNPKPQLLSNTNGTIIIAQPSWGKGDWEARWNGNVLRRTAAQPSYERNGLTVGGHPSEFQVRRVGETAWSEVLKVVATKEESVVKESVPIEAAKPAPAPTPAPAPVPTAPVETKLPTNTITYETPDGKTTTAIVTKVTIEGVCLVTPVS